MFGKVLEVMGCKKVINGKIDGAYKHFYKMKKILLPNNDHIFTDFIKRQHF